MKLKSVVFLLLFSAGPAMAQRLQSDLMPLRLNLDSTLISSGHLFGSAEGLESLKMPEGLRAKRWKEGDWIITGTLKNPVDFIRFEFKDGSVDLVVKRSLKARFDYQFPDPQHRYSKVQLSGDFNGWTASRTNLTYNQTKGEWQIQLLLDQGLQAYRLHLDGVEKLDSLNPMKRGNGLGGENSLWQIGEVAAAQYWNLDSLGGPVWNETPDYVMLCVNNRVIWSGAGKNFTAAKWTHIKLPDSGIAKLYACKGNQVWQDLYIPIQQGKLLQKPSLDDKHAMIMYFMMLDRFKDGNTTNNPLPLDSVLPQAQFLGGDLAGLNSTIESGYFDSLHCNTLWISPISENPKGAYGLWDKGGVRTRFSAYHGYWPVSFTAIDPRFGSDDDLRQVISSAHGKNYKVLLDYVAHHVHQEHPLYQAHPDWVTQLHLPDGSLNTERWDEYRLTTWFDVFLPTLDLARQDITDAVTDSALYWFTAFDLDGLRHDATKHVPLNYWKTLTYKLRTKTERGRAGDLYQIGETYGSNELISSYLGSDMLDAQFDFNLYDRALETFALPKDSASEVKAFDALKSAVEQSLIYYGAHHLMGNISGNQDKPRFMSLADGSVLPSEDTKLAGYTRNIQVQDTLAYKRLALMHAFNFSIPGVPIVYYGDEIGLAGGNDPDNRRMMRFSGLNRLEQELKNTVAALAKYRANSAAMKFGTTRVISGSNYMLLIRSYLNEHSVMVISRSGGTIAIDWPSDLKAKKWNTVLGEGYTSTGLNLKPESFILLETH
ncbi:MAG: alpha-amlyase [Bacteroidetes bacterium]|nr:MAG: alpha-amlyase [Bacteroidota bacterium]